MNISENYEQIVFELISYSGSARSYIFEAFNSCKEGKYDEAEKQMLEAKNQLKQTHKIQTELIQNEARGEETHISILLVHAQDHLMTSMLAIDLVERMIDMQKEINKLKQGK